MDKLVGGIALWCSMVFAQAATVPTGDSVWETIAKYGLPTVLTVLLLMGWYKRDEHTTSRFEELQDFVNDRLVLLIEDAALTKREVSSALGHLADAVRVCPGADKAVDKLDESSKRMSAK